MPEAISNPFSAPAPPCHERSPLFVVFNISSGRGNAEEVRKIIADTCTASGREHLIFTVEQPRNWERASPKRSRPQKNRRHRSGCGRRRHHQRRGAGDARQRLRWGIMSTFNYFSRTHAIPADTAEAMALLTSARPQAVQVGQVNERVFLVNASLGLYAKLLEDREAFKAQFGRSRVVAFGAALVTLLSSYRQWMLRIVWRGQERVIRTPTLFVGNNALQLERIGLPQAEALDHGELAAVALQPIGRLAMLSLMARGALGQLGDADNVTVFSFRSLTVDAARGRPGRRIKVATDGEIAWMRMPLVFQVASEPLWLIKPLPGEGLEARA
ncbi:MAG: diacylglycerol kinase [Variovorax sp.]